VEKIFPSLTSGLTYSRKPLISRRQWSEAKWRSLVLNNKLLLTGGTWWIK